MTWIRGVQNDTILHIRPPRNPRGEEVFDTLIYLKIIYWVVNLDNMLIDRDIRISGLFGVSGSSIYKSEDIVSNDDNYFYLKNVENLKKRKAKKLKAEDIIFFYI